MALSTVEREQFLAEPHVAALSVAAGPDRGPLAVPIWYGYEPGGTAWIVTPAASRKARLIEAAGRFTLLVDRVAPSVRYVSVEGPVAGIRPATEDDVRAMARRYLPPPAVEGYVQVALADHGEQVLVHLDPQRWLSADLG
ncbi:pyridoxamine 5'-phosphate oxidase family protein [Modestobacter sp. SYSU DS0290]